MAIVKFKDNKDLKEAQEKTKDILIYRKIKNKKVNAVVVKRKKKKKK